MKKKIESNKYIAELIMAKTGDHTFTVVYVYKKKKKWIICGEVEEKLWLSFSYFSWTNDPEKEMTEVLGIMDTEGDKGFKIPGTVFSPPYYYNRRYYIP